MSDANTLRILSIDGGGMRGFVPSTFMKLFVEQWGINPNEIWKYFDVIAGSSSGGFQGLGYAYGLTPTEMKALFTTDGPWIFTTDPLNPSVMPSTLSKINTIVNGPLANPTFYPSDVSGIGTMRLHSKLTEVFGSDTMQDLLTKVVITSFEKNDDNPDFAQNTNTPVYFSNISSTIIPILTGQTNTIVDVAMATSAAPLYFPPWVIDTDSYIDGGVTQNNPASFALAAAQAIKPGANRYCVLSLGTGLGDVGFPPEPPFLARARKEFAELNANPELYAEKWKIPQKEMSALTSMDLGLLEGAYLIMYLIGAMTTGPQEIVAQELKVRANYTLSNLYQYRMQYYFDPEKETELDNSTTDILDYYEEATTEYFNDNIDDILTFIGHLTA
jgi:hypothetical protein